MRPQKGYNHLTLEREQNEGVTRQVHVMSCSKCNAKIKFPKTGKRLIPCDRIAERAVAKGWTPDMKTGKHECPKHKDQPMQKTAPTPSQQPPRTMGRDDKRRIFREIDDNYDDVNARYVFDVDDKAIAQKLSVPVAWVTQVREDAFGPAGPDPKVVALQKELAGYRQAISDAEESILKSMDQVEALRKLADDLTARVQAVAGPSA